MINIVLHIPASKAEKHSTSGTKIRRAVVITLCWSFSFSETGYPIKLQ